MAVVACREVPSTTASGVERAEQPSGWFAAPVHPAATRAPDCTELRKPSCEQTDLHHDKGSTAYKKYCDTRPLRCALGGNTDECLQHVATELAEPKGAIHALSAAATAPVHKLRSTKTCQLRPNIDGHDHPASTLSPATDLFICVEVARGATGRPGKNGQALAPIIEERTETVVGAQGNLLFSCHLYKTFVAP